MTQLQLTHTHNASGFNRSCRRYIIEQYNRYQCSPEKYVACVTVCFIVTKAYRLFQTLPEAFEAYGIKGKPKHTLKLIEAAYNIWAANNLNAEIEEENEAIHVIARKQHDYETTLEWFENMAATFYADCGIDENGVAARISMVFIMLDEARIMCESVGLEQKFYPWQMYRNLSTLDEQMPYITKITKEVYEQSLTLNSKDYTKDITDPKIAVRDLCRKIIKSVFQFLQDRKMFKFKEDYNPSTDIDSTIQ